MDSKMPLMRKKGNTIKSDTQEDDLSWFRNNVCEVCFAENEGTLYICADCSSHAVTGHFNCLKFWHSQQEDEDLHCHDIFYTINQYEELLRFKDEQMYGDPNVSWFCDVCQNNANEKSGDLLITPHQPIMVGHKPCLQFWYEEHDIPGPHEFLTWSQYITKVSMQGDEEEEEELDEKELEAFHREFGETESLLSGADDISVTSKKTERVRFAEAEDICDDESAAFLGDDPLENGEEQKDGEEEQPKDKIKTRALVRQASMRVANSQRVKTALKKAPLLAGNLFGKVVRVAHTDMGKSVVRIFGKSASGASLAFSGIGFVVLFVAESSYYVAQWYRNKLSGKDLAEKISTCAISTAAGFGGATGGAVIGALLGTFAGPMGVLVGAILGGMVGGYITGGLARITYRKILLFIFGDDKDKAVCDALEYYQLEATCSIPQVNRVFKRLSLRFHPDKNPNNQKQAQEEMQKILFYRTTILAFIADRDSALPSGVARRIKKMMKKAVTPLVIETTNMEDPTSRRLNAISRILSEGGDIKDLKNSQLLDNRLSVLDEQEQKISKFQVGDRIRCVGVKNAKFKNQIGNITSLDGEYEEGRVAVKFDSEDLGTKAIRVNAIQKVHVRQGSGFLDLRGRNRGRTVLETNQRKGPEIMPLDDGNDCDDCDDAKSYGEAPILISGFSSNKIDQPDADHHIDTALEQKSIINLEECVPTAARDIHEEIQDDLISHPKKLTPVSENEIHTSSRNQPNPYLEFDDLQVETVTDSSLDNGNNSRDDRVYTINLQEQAKYTKSNRAEELLQALIKTPPNLNDAPITNS